MSTQTEEWTTDELDEALSNIVRILKEMDKTIEYQNTRMLAIEKDIAELKDSIRRQ